MSDGLYPEISPYYQSMLTCNGHQLYYELSGNPEAPTALFLHGGPGGGTSPRARQFFNPEEYRIVLLDQRGSGKSKPNVSENYDAALRNNTTGHLIADIEQLRKELSVDRWQLILGGSWGSTLALAYSQAYPNRVDQLLLRGVFTFLPDEVDSLFQNGRAADHYPEEWQSYVEHIRASSNNWQREQHNLLSAYRERLEDPQKRMAAAQAFVSYELSISHLIKNTKRIENVVQNPDILVPFASLEVHYMLHGGFLRRGQLLEEIRILKNHRIHIVHGRNDAVCLPKSAARLCSALWGAGAQNVTLEFVDGAGHSDEEAPIARALRLATDSLAAEAKEKAT